MNKGIILVYLALIFILASTVEAKGGRSGGGGRSSGRSSSRSSGSRRGSTSSTGSSHKSSSSFGGSHSHSSSTSGGWFHGFFHSSPHRYTYRPTYISVGHSHYNSYPAQREERERENLNKETNDYAVGYSISRALNSDFFSIFNVVHDIGKYPEKIRNKEFITTTTEGPVSTYNINDVITPSYTLTSEPYYSSSKLDDILSDMIKSHNLD